MLNVTSKKSAPGCPLRQTWPNCIVDNSILIVLSWVKRGWMKVAERCWNTLRDRRYTAFCQIASLP